MEPHRELVSHPGRPMGILYRIVDRLVSLLVIGGIAMDYGVELFGPS